MTETRRVTLIPGDGIGPSVVDAAVRVLDAAGAGALIDWDVHEVGLPSVAAGGSPFPPSVLESIRANGVALKGPVSTPKDKSFPSVNIGLRRELDLFVQLRPCQSASGFDVVVMRETTEDLYAGFELPPDMVESVGLAPGTAVSLKPVSAPAVRRAAEFAVQWMQSNGRRKLTIVHKAAVMPATDGLFLQVCREVAAGAGVECDDKAVDLAAAELVQHPDRFDVILTGNLYGDILSDLAGALVGGIGLVPGANYGDGIAMFEAAHGSAPKHAGQDYASPVAMIRCAALLARHLGWPEVADRIESAVWNALGAGVTGTTATTSAVLAAL